MKVVHLIDETTPRDLLDQLAALAGPEEAVVSVGPPPLWDARPVRAVHRPLGLSALAARWMPAAVNAADLLHAWSVPALMAALSCPVHARPILSLPAAPRGKPLAQLADRLRRGEAVVTVPTEAGRAAILAAGAPADSVYVLRPPAEPPVAAARTRARRELGLADGHVLLVAPGEMTPAAGHKYAPWVHAVLRHVRDDLRLVLPRGGTALERVRFYVGTTGLGEEVFLTEGRLSQAEALAAADLAVFLPERDGGVGALAAAMAAGLPIVASRTPDVVECAGEESALLVRPASPREASAGVLRVLEEPGLAPRLASSARRRAEDLFAATVSRARRQELYRRVLGASSAPAHGHAGGAGA